MAVTLFTQQTANLYAEYVKIIDGNNGRARDLSLVEAKIPQKLLEGDLAETKGIIQLYLSGIALCAKALKNGDLEKFDAVIGDHNCHVTALFAIFAFKDPVLKEEAERLSKFVSENKNRANGIKLGQPMKPLELITTQGYQCELSKKMKYLVCAALLKVGTECTENRDGSMTLKVVPRTLANRVAKQCPIVIVERLITPLREYVNSCSVEFVQQVGRTLLPEAEAECLEGAFVKSGKTVRQELFQFPCAFYNMKAALLDMAQKQIPFVVVKYDRTLCVSHVPLIFSPSMQLVEASTLKPDETVFVLQCFFNEELSVEELGKQLETYGLVKFILASVAINPQFVDMKPEEFVHNEDVQQLPSERRDEILYYRAEGKRLGVDTEKPSLCRIAHSYADQYKNIKQKKV